MKIISRWRARLERHVSGIPDLGKARGMARLKIYLRCVLGLEGDPRWIARSFAVGVFIAVSPIYGTHTLTVLILIPLLRLHPAAALIGSLLNIPPIAPLVYGSAFTLGSLLIGAWHGFAALPGSWEEWCRVATSWDGVEHILLPLALGSVLIGFCAAIIAYAVSLRAIERYKRRQRTSSTSCTRTSLTDHERRTNDEGTESRVSGGRHGDEILARKQSAAQGDAPHRRQAGDPICR
jgi:hypothetical protein